MSSSKPNIFLLLQEAMIQLVEKTSNVKNWGVEQENNEGLYLDLQHAFKRCQDELHLLTMKVSEQNLEIRVTIGPVITSWEDVRGSVYRLLGLVAEQLLMVVQTQDEETFQFWFVIGDLTHLVPHGHFGVIKIPLEDVKHLDPDEYESL